MLSARCSAPGAQRQMPAYRGEAEPYWQSTRFLACHPGRLVRGGWRYGASSLPTWAPMWADRRSALVKVSSVNAAGSVFASAVNSTGDWAPHTARQRPGSTANLPTPSDS